MLARWSHWPVKEPGERAKDRAAGALPATPADSSGQSEDEPGSRAQSLTPQETELLGATWAKKLSGCQAANTTKPLAAFPLIDAL